MPTADGVGQMPNRDQKARIVYMDFLRHSEASPLLPAGGERTVPNSRL